MEYIWDRIPKNKGGKTIRYLAGDIPYLYENGFVDAAKFTYKQWKQSFEAFKQEDGSYILTKEDFFTLRLFRYNGPSHDVFNAEKLREGPWPDDELEFLYNKSIQPSSRVAHDIYWNSINALKRQGFVNENNELIVNDKVKKQLTYLVEKFPSPRRRLEKEVKKIREQRSEQMNEHMKNRNASGFSVGETQSEEKNKEFEKLQSKQQTQSTSSQKQKNTKEESFDLKSLKKPRGNFRG